MSNIGIKVISQTFFINLAITIGNVITGILTARLLSASGRGELAIIMLWPCILESLGQLGTNTALTREVAAHPDDENELAYNSVLMLLFLSLLTIVIGYVLIPFLLPEDKLYLANLTKIFLVYIPISFFRANFIALDYGRLRWRRFNLLRTSMIPPLILFILVLWILGLDTVGWYITAFLASHLVSVFLGLSFHWRNLTRGILQVHRMVRLIRHGMPFFLFNISTVISMQIDRALAVFLLSTTAIGYYAVASSFASVHGALGGALGITSFAALATEPDPVRQGKYLSMMFRQATLLYLAAGAAVALLAPLVIVPLFGEAFAPSIKPAVFLSLAITLESLNIILIEGLQGMGNTYPAIFSQIVGAGILSLTAWVMVPHLGLIGMAYAAVLAGIAQILFMVSATAYLFKLDIAQFWGVRPQEVRDLYRRIVTFISA